MKIQKNNARIFENIYIIKAKKKKSTKFSNKIYHKNLLQHC